MIKKGQKAIVAMSGGIDSSVAAALLKKAGFNVIGIFMKLAGLSRPDEEKRAKKIAKILGIPFLSLDLRREFKKRIIERFLKEHKAGLTPNPCVVCNKEIKFGLLLRKALALNADFVATGHYARKIQTAKVKSYKLLKAEDKNKDQSYFLWMLNQKQLKRVLFPVGNYTRKEVEKLARKFRLPVLKAKKSVEICFIKTTANDFLKKHFKEEPGKIVDNRKKEIGRHQGLYFYTIGQRKGIGLPGGPYYVLDKDFKKNLLIVTKNEKDLYKKELIAKNVNWISGKKPKLPLKVKAKIRYRHKVSPATVYKIQNTKYKILFSSSQRAVTPGQSVVFYQGQELLGGGIIC